MSLQAIARTAGVSKALLLYHYDGKAALLTAVVRTLGAASEVRLKRAATAADAMEAWRALARDETVRGEVALLAALSGESEPDVATVREVRAAREAAAALLATAILGAVQLAPRVPAPLLGRLLLRQIDGAAVAGARDGTGAAGLDAELDAFALALLALGR